MLTLDSRGTRHQCSMKHILIDGEQQVTWHRKVVAIFRPTGLLTAARNITLLCACFRRISGSLSADGSAKLSAGAIAGIVIGTVAATAVAMCGEGGPPGQVDSRMMSIIMCCQPGHVVIRTAPWSANTCNDTALRCCAAAAVALALGRSRPATRVEQHAAAHAAADISGSRASFDSDLGTAQASAAKVCQIS
jgi:hypothetical protein